MPQLGGLGSFDGSVGTPLAHDGVITYWIFEHDHPLTTHQARRVLVPIHVLKERWALNTL